MGGNPPTTYLLGGEKQVHSMGGGDWYLSATHRGEETEAGKTVEDSLARVDQKVYCLPDRGKLSEGRSVAR